MAAQSKSRPEDVAHLALLEARRGGENWPEPETSALYYTLRAGADIILKHVIGRSDRGFAFEIATKVILDLWKFQGKSKFSTWFYRYVTNEALQHIRKQKLRREVPLDDNEFETLKTGSQLEIYLLLHKLHPSTAEIKLIQLMMLGYAQKEIAKKLGTTEEGVRMRWRRLRAKLTSLVNS